MNRPTILDTADLAVVPIKQSRYKLADGAWSDWHENPAILPFKFIGEIEERYLFALPHPTAWEEVKAWEAQLHREREYAWSEMKNAQAYWRVETSHAEAAEARAEAAEARIRELEARLEAAEKVIAPLAELSTAIPDQYRCFLELLLCPDGDDTKRNWSNKIRAAAKWMEDRNAEV